MMIFFEFFSYITTSSERMIFVSWGLRAKRRMRDEG